MFFDLSPMELFIEVFVGNQSQGKQRIQAPEIVLRQQFNQLINEIGRYQSPAKIIFSQPTFNEEGKQLKDNIIIFENFRYRNEFGGNSNDNL